MNQLCKVCDEPAAGFHFGAFTCEGCKVNTFICFANCRAPPCMLLAIKMESVYRLWLHSFLVGLFVMICCIRSFKVSNWLIPNFPSLITPFLCTIYEPPYTKRVMKLTSVCKTKRIVYKGTFKTRIFVIVSVLVSFNAEIYEKSEKWGASFSWGC